MTTQKPKSSHTMILFRLSLKLWFKNSQLNQKQAAAFFGLKQSHLSTLMLYQSCSLFLMEDICQKLGVELFDFLALARVILNEGPMTEAAFFNTTPILWPQFDPIVDPEGFQLVYRLCLGQLPEPLATDFRQEHFGYLLYNVEPKAPQSGPRVMASDKSWLQPYLPELYALDPQGQAALKALLQGLKKIS